MLDLVPSWLEVRGLSSSVCVVSRPRRRPSNSLAKVCSPVGGRVSFVFVMAFVDRLHEVELPICRLHVGFPYAIRE